MILCPLCSSIRKYLYQKFMPRYLLGREEISYLSKQKLLVKITLETGLCETFVKRSMVT